MKRTMLLPALLLVALVAGVRIDVTDTARHFALSKSEPADSSVVEAPAAVRLWFTEVPEAGTTSIRLLGEGAESVHVDDVAQDETEPTLFSVALHGTLPPGPYTVAWRAMGQDGHVVRDELTFTVTAR